MGAVSSTPNEASPLYLTDQVRFSIAGITVTNARGQTLLRVTPNAFPASRYSAHREPGDEVPLEYVQDPEVPQGGGPPSFLLRLTNSDELVLNFTINVRQQSSANDTTSLAGQPAAHGAMDTQIAGLTYIFASSAKEMENLIVREFHTDPNLHKNPNVELLGDVSTSGSPIVQFRHTWRWRPPKPAEDRGGGWRNSCSFVEYNQRAHRLDTLATFSFWVQNVQRPTSSMAPRSPLLELSSPPRLRVPSTQSVDSRASNISDSEGEGSYRDPKEPQSPVFEPIPENGLGLIPTMTTGTGTLGLSAVKVDVATCKPGEDPSTNEDGPLFRATMRSLEQKTGHMRQRMKKVLRTAEAAETAQHACNQAVADFTEALREAASSNANAVKPALDHYFEKIAKEILAYEQQNAHNLHKLIIDPISKLYNIEIKQADFKKREFDEDSKEYYAYVSKYLGQRSESLKEKKQKQSDEKYQTKRRTFELKRFDYSSFMHDLHGGRKDQEVLSHLTKYADAQAHSYQSTARKIDEMMPQLDALIAEVKTADQDFQLQRTEREEKRRTLEKSSKLINEDGAVVVPGSTPGTTSANGVRGDGDLQRSASVAGALSQSPPSTGMIGQSGSGSMLAMATSSAAAAAAASTSPVNKFKGIRDLEDNSANFSNNGAFRKEGLLWALSRPGSHADPKGINKAAWHKFWIVLDQGKLSEYVNWKDKLDLHIDPIDLRVASVREARNTDRRFCFEVITPHFTRVYQAPSEDDMKSWIAAINNALQSAFEARDSFPLSPSPTPTGGSARKDLAAVLMGKSSSFSGHRQTSNPNRLEAQKAVGRHATTGDKPAFRRGDSGQPESSALLQRIRAADEGNRFCADCGSDSKVDWCSINLGALLCIECSGIHRSLGTHISKVRSLTLDTAVFTADLIEILLLVGNRVSNMIWEAKLDRFLKPSPHSTRDQRLHFITAKYSDRTYVQGLLGTQTAEDHLLTSIKRNSIQDVLHAVALRANPNAHDRSRSTHALYLALAAADPASPSAAAHQHSASASTIKGGAAGSLSPSLPHSRSSSPIRKPFAIAELLLQNGAEIPSEAAPILLSQAARQYLDMKNELRTGRSPNGTTRDVETDHAPAVGPPVSNSASGNYISGATGNVFSGPTFQSFHTPLTRDRDRLIKRNSTGAPIGPTHPPRPTRSTLGGDALENFVKK